MENDYYDWSKYDDEYVIGIGEDDEISLEDGGMCNPTASTADAYKGANMKQRCPTHEGVRMSEGEQSQKWVGEDKNLGGRGDDIKFEAVTWENIMRRLKLAKTPRELQRNDIVNKTFTSIDDAELFYTMYATAMGFSVRKGQKRKRSSGEIGLRSWLCSKEGHRRSKVVSRVAYVREPRGLTRAGCKVEFRVVKKLKGNIWVVTEFTTDHSHELTPTNHVKFLRSNRVVTEGTMHTAKAMKMAGVRSSQIMNYMAQLLGRYDKVPFMQKDLCNKLMTVEQVKLADADAAKAIGYLQHKADNDMRFIGKYNYDETMRLMNVIWVDARSRVDYKVFGDALAFDTTYRTNKFGKPLLVFVGINHHFKSTIFGVALMDDESLQSYRWALGSFLECMDGVGPKTVMTDGDMAMRRCIQELLPHAVHRLCRWHIEQNAISNVKDRIFITKLQRFYKHLFDHNEFEKEWNAMVEELGLQENEWVNALFNKRKQWAATYFRQNFFGGMSTTQRCEGMNWFLKSKGKSTMSLSGFVRGFDMSLSWLRHNEAKADFESNNSEPMVGATNMDAVECQCANMYTRAIYYKVRLEILKEGCYKVIKVDGNSERIVVHLCKYGKVNSRMHTVSYAKDTNFFECDCFAFPTTGMPCRHIFSSMKHLNMTKLPDCMIMQRWTKMAKQTVWDEVKSRSDDNISQTAEALRFGDITTRCTEIAFYASKSQVVHEGVRTELNRLSAKLLASIRDYKAKDEWKEKDNDLEHPVRNPRLSNTKGSGMRMGNKGKRKKQCSNCKQRGHNKATCKNRAKHFDTPMSCGNSANGMTSEQTANAYEAFSTEFASNGLQRISEEGANTEQSESIVGDKFDSDNEIQIPDNWGEVQTKTDGARINHMDQNNTTATYKTKSTIDSIQLLTAKDHFKFVGSIVSVVQKPGAQTNDVEDPIRFIDSFSSYVQVDEEESEAADWWGTPYGM